jgi:hypothetical protein
MKVSIKNRRRVDGILAVIPFHRTPLFVFYCSISLIPRTPDISMKAYTRISLPVIKLNVSSPEGDDNKYEKGPLHFFPRYALSEQFVFMFVLFLIHHRVSSRKT